VLQVAHSDGQSSTATLVSARESGGSISELVATARGEVIAAASPNAASADVDADRAGLLEPGSSALSTQLVAGLVTSASIIATSPLTTRAARSGFPPPRPCPTAWWSPIAQRTAGSVSTTAPARAITAASTKIRSALGSAARVRRAAQPQRNVTELSARAHAAVRALWSLQPHRPDRPRRGQDAFAPSGQGMHRSAGSAPTPTASSPSAGRSAPPSAAAQSTRRAPTWTGGPTRATFSHDPAARRRRGARLGVLRTSPQLPR
jgi:hypothetical protein